MPSLLFLLVALTFIVPLLSGCETLNGCFCCNNCLVNYFTDMPKGQTIDALYRQERYDECVATANEIKTPTGYQKIVHAKCLEGSGDIDGAHRMYREIIATDPQLLYSPAREAKAHLDGLAKRPGSSKQRVSSGQWPSLSSPPAKVGGGERDAAVVVGVGASFMLPKIDGAAENATDWYTWLTAGLGVLPERITLLRNEEATREAILEASVRAARAAEGGRVWFVFIGHGAPAPRGDDGLLLGADAQATEKSLQARGLSQRELLAALRAGRARSVVAVFDACFSGTARDGTTPLVPGSQATIPVRRQRGGDGLGESVVVFSSSDRVAGPLPGAGRPAFSYLLLGALRGWGDDNRDGTVSAEEAWRYADGVLRAAVHDRDQTPSLETSKRNTPIARSAGEAAPDVAAILAGPVARY